MKTNVQINKNGPGSAARISALVLLVALVFVPGGIAAAASPFPGGGEVSYLINGDKVSGDAPVVMNERVLVPLDELSEELLIECSQNNTDQSMELVRGDETAVLPMEKELAIINGRQVVLDVSATSFGSKVYVPLRIVVESFGGTVQWDASRNCVLVSDQPSLYLDGIDARVVKVYEAADVNQWWLDKGYAEKPYKGETQVVEAELEADHTFGRVYDGDISGKYGGWLLNNSDLDLLAPSEIRNEWALPALPLYRVDVILDDGIHIRAGLAAPVAGWGDGGMVQFDLMGEKTGDFVNERPLN